MELIALIAFLWIVGHLFPGSGSGGGVEIAVVLAAIVCIVLVLAFFTAILHAAVFVGDWTGSAWLGVGTFVFLLFGSLFANKFIAEASDRRKAARAA